MCTLVILRRPDHPWPIILAANRDEMQDRPWRPPGRHWPDRPNVVAPIDLLAGGTWLGLNDEGVVAGIMNRRGTLGPAAGKRSRGELVLEALDHADAAEAARALSHLELQSYRPFNLVVADDRDAFWLRGAGDSARDRIEAFPLPPGVSMVTACDRNDPGSLRIGTYLPRFEAAPAPEPEAGDWAAWRRLLASREHAAEGGPTDAMNVATDTGFGTTSSALIALPSARRAGAKPVWLFAAGAPDAAVFEPVSL